MNGKRCKQCLSLLLMGMLALLLLSGCGTAEKDSGGDPAKLSSFEKRTRAGTRPSCPALRPR